MNATATELLGAIAPDEQMVLSDGSVVTVANPVDLPPPLSGNVWVVLLHNSQVTQRSANVSGIRTKLKVVPDAN